MRSEILEKLKDILRMVGSCDEGTIASCTEGTHLLTDLGLTSVGMLYIVIAVEEFFNIRFDNVDFNDFQTVGDVITYIQDKQK